MAIVHCRYGHVNHGGDDGIDLPDGYVWLCLGAIGPEDAPGDRLEPYHDAEPFVTCSCGYDPLPPAPSPQPDGCWRPAGHP